MKTTKKDYEEFKRWCRHYQDKFHLNDWQLYYKFRKMEDSFSSAHVDWKNLTATMALSSCDRNSDPHETMEILAKHEVIHILTSEMNNPHISSDERDKAWERCVHRLEKLL